MADPFAVLERGETLARTARLLEEARHSGGGTLVVEGHAGLGKTRLLEEIAARAAATGIAVIRARGRELERDFAWGGCLQLLQSVLDGRDEAERAALVAGPGARALSLLDAPVAGASLEVDLPLLHAVAAVLAAAGGGRPQLILVDDAQWLDVPSLRALHYLIGRLAGRGAVLVLARRTGEPSGSDELLDGLGAESGVEVVTLAPLGQESVAALVHDVLPAADADLCAACFRASRGNPLYLRQLLDELPRQPNQDAAAVDALVPSALGRSVLLRLGRLGAPAVALARSVATLADGAVLAIAATLAGLGEEEALAAAAMLVRADLLVDQATLAFVHPLVRRAVVQDQSQVEQARRHAQAAELLHRHGAAPEAVATQLLLATPSLDRWAVDVLRAAAARAMARAAPRSAVAYLERVLAEPLDAATRAGVLVELGQAESAAGVPVRAHFQEALAVISEPGERARLLQTYGWALHRTGRFGEATDAFAEGLAIAGGDAELTQALEFGRIASMLLSTDHATEAGAAAAELTGRPAADLSAGERSVVSGLITMQVYAGAPVDPIRVRARELDVGRVIVEQTADDHTVWHLVGILSWTDAADVEDALDLAFADAHRRASVLAFAMASYARSWPRLWCGRLDDAAADAQAAVDAWMHGLEMYLPAAIYWLVRAHLERGDVEAADRAATRMGEVHAVAGGMGAFRHEVEAYMATARGDHARALAAHREAGALISGVLGARNPSLMPWASEAALSALALGDHDQARQLALDELERAVAFGAPRAHGTALRVHGLVTQDLPSLERAVALLDDDFSRLEHAKALVSLGATLRRQGRRRDAREPLERGLDIAHRCGARTLETEAREELIAAGGRPRRAARSGVAALTPSERRVAVLAAAGASNREIAARLFVTVSTVEWHLGNAFGKLDITSRQSLAAALEQA